MISYVISVFASLSFINVNHVIEEQTNKDASYAHKINLDRDLKDLQKSRERIRSILSEKRGTIIPFYVMFMSSDF